MRVLMLGWEFPPSINGGLGTACAGLVRALDDQGVNVTFITPEPPLPKPPVAHAKPFAVLAKQPSPPPMPRVRTFRQPRTVAKQVAVPYDEVRVYQHVTFRTVPVRLTPYETTTRIESVVTPVQKAVRKHRIEEHWVSEDEEVTETYYPAASNGHLASAPQPLAPETGLFGDVKRYTEYVEELARDETFDVIHAHDWMTFPAALAVAGRSGKPLVVHVHSMESDRGGRNGDGRIAEIERRAMHVAIKVIAVSEYTKHALIQQYGVSPDKIDVVYNGVEPPPNLKLAADEFSIKQGEKVVLFLGRLTMQKGPEYFITAARKVLEVMDDVKFIVAGDGDLARSTVELAATFGIAHKVLFTGFLRGLDVERIYQIADLFVMPSVSEPFGIAPLEAVARNVPTIISKQSGVSEVLKHALKVDFWDTNELANKIVSVLRYPTLASMLKEDGSRDVAKLSWDAAAKTCVHIYGTAINTMPVSVGSASADRVQPR